MIPKVLIVDDSVDYCSTVADIVNSEGYETITCYSPENALKIVEDKSKLIALILLDIEFAPDSKMNGLDLLIEIRKNYPFIPVVIISGKGTIPIAVQATKNGASDVIEKHIVSKEKIQQILKTFISKLLFDSEKKDIINFLKNYGMYGESDAILKVGESIIRFGRTHLNVLITGATGTGKRLVAKAIHSASQRAKFPFVTVDIPNIPRELFQSELFGHVKGSFTGSFDNKDGLFHQANRGTLFLDEISNLSLDLQSNLLIPIEEKMIKKVGSTKTEPIDVRFIAATDKELLSAIKEGKFKEQLYHRLRECEIILPTLKERVEDIPIIVESYIRDYNQDKEIKKIITKNAISLLIEQEWTGNVRQLLNIVKSAYELSDGESIDFGDIKKALNFTDIPTAEISDDTSGPLDIQIHLTYKSMIERILDESKGNASKAAAKLGISRETLYLRIKRYNIDINKYRKKEKQSTSEPTD